MGMTICRVSLIILIVCQCANTFAQTGSQIDYYVVVSEFQTLEEAEKYTDAANLKGFSAQYAIHESKEYYVFLLQTPNKKKANEFRKQIRRDTEYKNAWIYKGKLGVQ